MKLTNLRFSGFLFVTATAVAMTISACGGDDNKAATANSVTVPITAQNNSGISGNVTLTANGEDKTDVVFNLTGAPAGVAMPAHFHDGSCAKLGDVVVALTDVVDGKSTTTVNKKLSELQDKKYPINIHKSKAEIKTYVGCGDTPGK